MFHQIILFSVLIISLLGCNRFNKADFLHKAFGKDIAELSVGKDIHYKDGLLEVNCVFQTDKIYSAFFSQVNSFTISENVIIESGCGRFEAIPGHKIYYSVFDQFDGYTKVVLYIPKELKMVFVYSTGII